jgi:hypothetical protein
MLILIQYSEFFIYYREATSLKVIGLRYKRQQALEILERMPTITIERNTIVPTLLELYKTNSLSLKFVNFIIKNELAQDLDGVKREIYSIFWDEITSLYFEGGKSVVLRVGPDVTDELCTILGRAIIHTFLITGIWPIQISKLFSIAILVGEESLTNDNLLDAFLEYVLEYESIILQKALTEAESGSITLPTQQQVLDVLAPFGLRSLPTHTNIKSLLVSTAKCELVQKVNRSINKFREGLLDMALGIKLLLMLRKKMFFNCMTNFVLLQRKCCP